jgi:hypothetical protein
MEWYKVDKNAVRRFMLEDGGTVIAVVKNLEGSNQVTFYSDIAEIERVEAESKKLGGLPDLIEALRPQDIIEICCRLSKRVK